MGNQIGIRVLSSSCGVLPHTLRIWEKRYQVFRPERSKNGQRLYGQEDLKKAQLLSKLIDAGHSISSLSSLSLKELNSMAKLITNSQKQPANISLYNINSLLRHLKQYRLEQVASELHYLRQSAGVKDFIFHVVLPTLREIGSLVQKKKYSITQEHIVSTLVRDQISQIYMPNINMKEDQVILATPEGNQHELPILIADILCRANRWPTHYLGASHPADCLAWAINALKCPYLVLGALTSDQWNYERKIIPFLKKIDRHLKEDLIVIVGGGSMLDFPSFKKITQVRVLSTLEKFEKFLNNT